MAAITENVNVDRVIDQDLREYDVLNGVHIYRGALVGLRSDSGSEYLVPFAAGDEFVGIAYEEADNTDGSNGDTNFTGSATKQGKCRAFIRGDFVLTLSGTTQARLKGDIYAVDSSKTVAVSGSNAAKMGFVVGLNSATEPIVRLQPRTRTVT